LKRKRERSLQGAKEQGHWANMHLVYWNVGYKEGETARWKHVNIPYLLNYALTCTAFTCYISVIFSPLSLYLTIHNF